MSACPLILIVEDDDTIAGIIEEYVQDLGHRTKRAADGREAIDLAANLHPDLIIMDLMMPHLTGGEAAVELRRDPLMAQTPIVAISAVEDAASLAELLPFDAVIEKPFDLDDLSRVINQFLPRLHNHADAANVAASL